MGKIENVLLTGGNGFLGSFILKELLKNGYRPLLLLRPHSDTWRIKEEISECILFTLTGNSDIERLFSLYEIDSVIHTATDYGKNSSLTNLLKTNVIFPINLLEEGSKRQLKLFINTDSFFAKKCYNQAYLREYTNSKRILEQLLIDLRVETKIVNLRLEHIYGEKDREDKFFITILKKLLADEPEIALTEGKQERDFIYAGDVATAYTTIINNVDSLEHFQEFEVGTGEPLSLRKFVETLAIQSGSKSSLKFGEVPTRQGEIASSFAHTEALLKLGWRQQYSTDQAIRHIIRKEKERFLL